MSHEKLFENKSIQHLIVLFSFPTIFSLVLESFVSMIDTAFAGHLGSMSSIALSAMGLLTPILQILLAAQLIFGVSTSIVVSKRLGEKNQEKVNETFTIGFYGCGVFSIAISLLIFLLQDPLLFVLGASGEVRRYALQYLNLALIFNIFNSLGYMLVNMIRVFGYPKMEIIIGVISTLSNVFFNVLFTFILGLGFIGIAFATLTSSVIYFSCAVLFLMHKKLWMKKVHLIINPSKEILISIIKIGFVQFLMQALNSVSGFVINRRLIGLGYVSSIGAFAICNNINTVILLPLIGLTQGSQSVIAYFHGRQNHQSERIAKQKIVNYSLIYALVITIVSLLWTRPLLMIFTSDESLIQSAIPILRIMVAGFPFMGIIYTLITFMQVSKEEAKASQLEVVRQIVLLIPLVIVFSVLFSRFNIFNISAEQGMFLAFPLTNMIIVLFYFKKIKTIYKDD
ncbi:MAG: MATE family efflux transporter [Turicibacter sanguinis]|uniref:Multidrug export protein MepA n=2 Tax=Turicibacter sanguinis TaxID=154288 RepID=A0A9X5APS0_9FIRM|nr:MATE family efflux transporter [Turicibacter sanguinis]EFF63855.1 MATE efflux family protein [Turicibacter sanguinis PC909]MCU7191549.1 MATE family efflux transporter [Turicibacter sanguinis]MCU7195461.1 MATE family efflux transporter [Turicibacter sanguinis]MDB8563803.1 MATE family efflux transporter [Turicibacter sanguinis]MTK21945.1 MATE family efflux transporter [Turicibacter sanguinis]